jgi:hypothetical protein
VYSVSSGSAADAAMSQALGLAIRHLAVTFLWVLVAGLAAAAGCWCCGYVAREAWLKAGPPARRPKPQVTVEDAVSLEAARGIEEIEAYLTAACSPRSRPPHLDGGA